MNRSTHSAAKGQKPGPSSPVQLRTGKHTELRSSFALNQLTDVARSNDPGAFVLAMVPVFGYDVAPQVYFALHAALIAGEIANPQIELSTDCNYPAEYDDIRRRVLIHVDALERARQSPDNTWEILAVLLHEFGNHLNEILRIDLVARFPDAVDELEATWPNEKAFRYARYIAHLPSAHQGPVEIASLLLGDGEVLLLETPYATAAQLVSRNNIYGGLPTPVTPEGFEASSSHSHHYSHQSIEANLLSLLTAREIRSISFGNWLRDYSQLLDPKLVRATHQPINFPAVLSREALTGIVDILAVRKFSDVRADNRSAFTVTAQKLGVYRPSQHVDNPRVVNPSPPDPTLIDRDFEPWVLPGDPLLQVDSASSMKRYIQRSVDVMQQELEAALHYGRGDEGLRRLGAALHTLEDYFSHSNFVELSLIKAGHEVLPWTAPTNCKWGLPVVTGSFGSSDVIASLAGPIAEVLAPSIDWRFTPTRPGDRSDSEKMMIILFNESGHTAASAAYKSYLEMRDTLTAVPGNEYVQMYSWATGAPGRLVSNAMHSIFREMMTRLGNSIGDWQTLSGSDPHIDSSIDPTHSQLAKDHAEHPLHALAGWLAAIAIRDVTKAVRLQWWREPGAQDPIALATSFIRHPQDSLWQDRFVAHWARENPHQIYRASQKTELDRIGEDLQRGAGQSFRDFTGSAMATFEYLTEHFELFFGGGAFSPAGKALPLSK